MIPTTHQSKDHQPSTMIAVENIILHHYGNQQHHCQSLATTTINNYCSNNNEYSHQQAFYNNNNFFFLQHEYLPSFPSWGYSRSTIVVAFFHGGPFQSWECEMSQA
jgi:hypothetical protein